jgi:hypothetical protein
MPFVKGKPKTGGRQKGKSVPINQIRRDVADKLAALNFDPIDEMVAIATLTDDIGLKGRMCSELAKYVHAPCRIPEEPRDINITINQDVRALVMQLDDRLSVISRPASNAAIES